MISHIAGQLVEVHKDTVVIEKSGIGYVVAIPQYAISELAPNRGRNVTLHTLLFIDGNQSSGRLEPHLIGFPDTEDKRFFRRFISVKGVGWRKALKALTETPGRVAGWIERGDIQALKKLPGFGARAAEQIVAELKGKLSDLADVGDGKRPIAESPLTEAQRDALEVMVALGDGRSDAREWLDKAVSLNPGDKTSDEWLRSAYRVRAGVTTG